METDPHHTDDHQHDLDQIRALVADVAAGVAAKDVDRCTARFTPDARSVVASGRRAIGHDAIRAAHEDAFASAQAPDRPRFEVLDVLFVRPDVAVATTGGWALVDGEEVDPDRPASIATWVLEREGDGWWVAARQFTRVAA
jgi:uncharacterized protein (TIGR02246 family)